MGNDANMFNVRSVGKESLVGTGVRTRTPIQPHKVSDERQARLLAARFSTQPNYELVAGVAGRGDIWRLTM